MDRVTGGTQAPDWIGRRIGPYRVVALIARGGMGEVYRCERADGQYEQQVAMKLMRDGTAQDALLARFKAERQILASLDHPNLAKLLDAGVTPEGVPYFVMELVHGEPIDACCERLAMPLARRLQLFRTLCNVVHYAHRQGVIHRDIKPGNVLVTQDGVVKLVDFGIAKRIAPDGPATSVAAPRAITLACASPEQVRGEALTPASDVYSLGVLLHRLLARSSPYTAGPDDAYALARAICETEPTAPSRCVQAPPGQLRPLRRRLRGDLDAVVAMALRKQPERRYPSAEALAEDVFRHLEGLPVLARRRAWSYRAGRFLLRHRAVAGAALAANLALVAGIGLASYQTWQMNAQRERAERHFDSVRRLAHTFVFDLHDAISHLPGATAARDVLVREALVYLERLSAESAGDPALQLELATGYRKVGDIEGMASGPNLGNPDAALLRYDRGLALLEPLLEATAAPSFQAEVRKELTALYQHKGGVLGSRGRFKEAEDVLRAGVAVGEALVAGEPDNLQHRHVLAQLHGQQSLVYLLTGRGETYLQASTRAQALFEGILDRDPTHAEAAGSLAIHHANRGEYFMRRDAASASAELALDDFTKAARLMEHQLAARPNDARLSGDLAVTHDNIGSALLRLAKPRDAAARHLQALQLFDSLSARDAADASHLIGRARSLGNLGAAHLALGEIDASLRRLLAAVSAFDAMPSGTQQDTDVRYSHAHTLFRLGRALEARAAGRRSEQQRRADLSLARERYQASLPIVHDVRRRLGAGGGQSLVGPEEVSAALQRVETALAAASGARKV